MLERRERAVVNARARPALAIPVALVVAAVAGGCTRGQAGSTTAGREELQVYAAASLATALREIAPAYEAATAGAGAPGPGVHLTLSTDASSALETKIEQGAAADVFLSADVANPQKLVEGGLAVGGVTPFASNRLVVIVPSANPAAIRSPADLARPGVKIIAAGPAVPISTYASQLLRNLEASPGYPAGFAAACAKNVVSQEDNVAAVVTKVALGEGDAAVVYATDAHASPSVSAIPVPDAANVVARYGGVVLKASPRAPAATAFLTWLAGPGGQAALGRYGFLPPASGAST